MSFRSEIRKILGEAFTDEIGDKLVSLHRTTLDPIKDELDDAKKQMDKYKADADKLQEVQKELDELKSGDYKAKYEKEKNDFDTYKAKIAGENETAKKSKAFRSLVKDVLGDISDARLDAIMKVTDLSGVKLDKEGNIQDADTHKKSIEGDYAEFKVSTRKRGEDVAHPPADSSGPKMTRQQIMEIKDDGERQKAIAENHEMFGF